MLQGDFGAAFSILYRTFCILEHLPVYHSPLIIQLLLLVYILVFTELLLVHFNSCSVRCMQCFDICKFKT